MTKKPNLKKALDRLGKMLVRLAGKPPFMHPRRLGQHSTVRCEAKCKDWWASKLDPIARGFEAATRKLAMVVWNP